MAKNIGVPTKEKDLLELAKRAKKAFVDDAAAYGFSADETEMLITTVDEFLDSSNDYRTKKGEAQTARAVKDTRQKHLKKVLGNYITRIRAKTDLPAGKLAAFGVQPIDKIKTPIPAPETAPLFNLRHSSAWHIIRFWEEGSSRRRRKPYGVIGAEIYVSVAADKNDLSAYRLMQIAVGSEYIFKYDWSEVGKQVHYYLRWLTRRGERSPLSRIESATIAT